MDSLVALLLRHGVLVVFAVTFLKRVGIPVPAPPLLVIAGALAAQGLQAPLPIFAAAVLANLAGDALWFEAGRRGGRRIMRLLCRISLSPDACVRQSEDLLVRWRGASLIAAKFVPGVSVVAAPMAGALAMPWPTFLVFDTVASAIWGALYMGLGLAFQDQIAQVLTAMSRMGSAALVLLVIALAAALAWRYWRRQRALRAQRMPRMTVAELRTRLLGPDAPLVIDVRSVAGAQADTRRIPGAMHMPLAGLQLAAASLPGTRDIVLYCDCPNDASAAAAAQMLEAAGLRRVWPLAGGIEAWFTDAATGLTPEASLSGPLRP